MIYSLLGSAELNGMDPEAYLTAVLRRIADLLPWNISTENVWVDWQPIYSTMFTAAAYDAFR